MTVKVFRSDLQSDSESLYRKWLSENPDGFVVNALRSAKGKESKTHTRNTRIHKADCPSINNVNKSAFTTSKHQKICATNIEDAESEATKVTGITSLIRCGCIKL